MSFGKKAAERLANKIILITGASSGIGEATAREFASASNGQVSLILAARREEKLQSLSKSLLTEWPSLKIHTQKLDVTKTETLKPFINNLPKDFSSIDVLINNAGKALGRSTVGSIDDADIDGMLNTNVLALIHMTQAVLPIFKQKNSGDIVNITSVAGKDSYPGGSVYCASKAAVEYFTNALRKELIDTKIRILACAPGAVKTEFSIVRFHGDEAAAEKAYEGTEPLNAQDIAEVIVFGVSRRANTVIADTLVFPSHQASGNHIYRKPT